MKTINQTEVTGKVISALLLQTVPGEEENAAAFLEKTAHVYKGLGKYDLVAIKEEKGSEFLDENQSFLNHIRGNLPDGTLDWMTVCGFKMNAPEKPGNPFEGSDVVGICCIKLNLDGITSDPLEVEQKIVRQLLEKVRKIHVLSGLGYNEIICIVERETINELSDAVNEIKSNSIDFDGVSRFLDINTIPCVNFKCIRTEDKPVGNTQATIMINLKTGVPTKLDSLLEKYLGITGELLFGFHDIIVNVDMPTNKLLRNLIALRSELVNYGLFSTCTLVRHLDNDIIAPKSVPWGSAKTIKKFKDPNSLPIDLIYYSDLYSVLSNDHFTRKLLPNLPKIFDTLSQEARDAMKCFNDGEMENYRRLRKAKLSMFSILNTFFQQRMSGIHIGNLLGTKSVSFETIGGVQRLSYALEAAPYYLISKQNLDWNGFCFFGHYHSFLSWYTHEILALPRKFLLDPKIFWGMNHESGHLVFLKLIEENKIFENQFKLNYKKAKEKIKKIIADNGSNEIPPEQISEYCVDLFSDVYADMFDFCYGFKSNWTLYKNTVWAYLKDFGPINHEYVTRSLLVFLKLGPGSKESLENSTDEYFEQLEVYFKSLGEELNVMKEKALVLRDILLETTDFFSVEMKKYLATVSMKENEAKLSEIRKALLEGKLLVGLDPTLIIQALLTIQNNPKATFSAILSLYNYGYGRYL